MRYLFIGVNGFFAISWVLMQRAGSMGSFNTGSGMMHAIALIAPVIAWYFACSNDLRWAIAGPCSMLGWMVTFPPLYERACSKFYPACDAPFAGLFDYLPLLLCGAATWAVMFVAVIVLALRQTR